MAFTVIVDWGARSRSLQPKLKSRTGGDSFLVASPGRGPVTLGWVSPLDIASWDTAITLPVTIHRDGNDLSVSAKNLTRPSLPDRYINAYLRLDFELSVTAAGKSAVVLAFNQLFKVRDTDALGPRQCAIDVNALQASPSGPVPKTGAVSAQRRRFLGLHPLLSVVPGKITVNCEFVDLTALWWSIRTDQLNWYLNSQLGGRHINLRVLGWTSGGDPMIWFAVVPDAAADSIVPQAGSDQPTPADVVFYRPQAGRNSFVYTAD